MDNKDSKVLNEYWHEESTLERFKKKAEESPFMIIGLVGLVGACGYGAMTFKNRGAMRPSIFLMRLRVIAQSAVIGSLTCGLVYSMVSEHLLNKKPQ